MPGSTGSGGARRKFAGPRLPALTELPPPPGDLTDREKAAWIEIGEWLILMRRLTAGTLLALRECACTRAELDDARHDGVTPRNVVRVIANAYWRQIERFGGTPATEASSQPAPDEEIEERGAGRFR